MSIVALKRKTNASRGVSSGVANFSVNGTHRNQGWVGQVGTPGRTVDCVVSTEDSTVLKASTLSNAGMIATKYQWIRRPAPHVVVAKSGREFTQSGYIAHLHKKTLRDCPSASAAEKEPVRTLACASKDVNANTGYVPPTYARRGAMVPDMPGKTGAISESERLERRAGNICELNSEFVTANRALGPPQYDATIS